MIHQGWIASLSSGETVREYPWRDLRTGGMIDTPPPMSPWQALIERCKSDNLRITQLRLQRGGVTAVALYGADGYMAAYEDRSSALKHKVSRVQGIGSVIRDYVFIIWMNDQGSVWQDVRKLSDVFVHTDMRVMIDYTG